MTFQDALNTAADIFWGPPMLILVTGTGLFLSICLRGIQFQKLFPSLYMAFITRREKNAQGDVTHFQALMTALAATVGTGNIAGVATAIVSGGPGALLWMWLTGLVGMATKFSEALLGVKFRILDRNGEMSGGPMYYLSQGLNQRVLAILFSLFAVFSFLVGGNLVQSNSIADGLQASLGIPTIWSGLGTAVASGIVILGGIRSIARVTATLVPAMILLYILAGLLVLTLNWQIIPVVFLTILKEAFSPSAVVGGIAGVGVLRVIRYGVARGVMSNESGLGTAGIAAAAAQTHHPVTQAMVSMTQTFIDTILVCSITGFVILGTEALESNTSGAALTAIAFGLGLPGWRGEMIVALCLPLFAFSTILGANYYGEKSLKYLFGDVRFVYYYRIIWVFITFLGAILTLDTVWALSDIMIAAMALPNLIGLLGLSSVIIAETRNYFSNSPASLDP